MSDARPMTEPGNPPHAMPGEPEHWLVRPATVRTLWIGFVALLVLAVVADLFVSHYRHFGVGGTFGFYVWFGFGSSVALFVIAKVLGIFLRRRDAYYSESVNGFPDTDGAPGSVPQGGWR
jgi:heme exporter protein D